jgi:apolipoprotein N-acyltransferase
MALSQPGFDLDWLAGVALVPLFFVLEAIPAKSAFFRAWISGFAFFGILLYWLFALGEWAGAWIGLGYLLLISYLALYWGLFGAVYSLLPGRSPLWLQGLAVPALWVFLEFARSLTRFGFTWGFLSDALYARPELIQISSATGAWGVSFLLVFLNFALFLTLKHRRVRYALAGLGLFILNGIYGVSILSEPDEQGRPLEVAIIHSHVSQRDRSHPGQLERLIALYVKQVEQIQEDVDLIILPETIVPGYILRQEELLARFRALAQIKQSWLLLGTIDRKPNQPGIRNTTALFSPEGRVVSEYDKVQLVPFSTEYFPFIQRLRGWGLSTLLNRVPLGSLTPGAGFEPLRGQIGTLATPICFESIFPAISRAFVRAGAQALITLTNDGWFKDSRELPQHFAKGVFRAVETRRYFVQASNAGVSGIVSLSGRILASTDSQKEQILRGRIWLQEGWTLYTRYGDWFIVLSLGLVLTALIAAFLGRRGSSARPG